MRIKNTKPEANNSKHTLGVNAFKVGAIIDVLRTCGLALLKHNANILHKIKRINNNYPSMKNEYFMLATILLNDLSYL